jgi:hypothetical protein
MTAAGLTWGVGGTLAGDAAHHASNFFYFLTLFNLKF